MRRQLPESSPDPPSARSFLQRLVSSRLIARAAHMLRAVPCLRGASCLGSCAVSMQLCRTRKTKHFSLPYTKDQLPLHPTVANKLGTEQNRNHHCRFLQPTPTHRSHHSTPPPPSCTHAMQIRMQCTTQGGGGSSSSRRLGQRFQKEGPARAAGRSAGSGPRSPNHCSGARLVPASRPARSQGTHPLLVAARCQFRGRDWAAFDMQMGLRSVGWAFVCCMQGESWSVREGPAFLRRWRRESDFVFVFDSRWNQFRPRLDLVVCPYRTI